MKQLSFLVDDASVGARIDKLISLRTGMTRSAVQHLLEQGMVTVNAAAVSKNHRTASGDRVDIGIPEPQPDKALPQSIPLVIPYEDDDLLVVDKPKGMVVHPAPGNPDGTLVNALLHHCEGHLSSINGVLRPGIVHRIDKDTSGLLIVAKNDFAHRSLAAQIAAHTFTRAYEAVATGRLREDSGKIDAPIGRHPVHRKQMAVTMKNSRNAVTNYKVIARYRGYTHLRLRLETGRTHQIRVHMAYLGHPLAGDTVYGGKPDKSLQGQCLHACTIGFNHPRGGRYFELHSELPPYFTDFLGRLVPED